MKGTSRIRPAVVRIAAVGIVGSALVFAGCGSSSDTASSNPREGICENRLLNQLVDSQNEVISRAEMGVTFAEYKESLVAMNAVHRRAVNQSSPYQQFDCLMEVQVPASKAKMALNKAARHWGSPEWDTQVGVAAKHLRAAMENLA